MRSGDREWQMNASINNYPGIEALRDMSMYKFRKKAVEIEAFQMTRERRLDNSQWPDWLNEAWNKENNVVGSVYPRDFPESDGNDQLVILTLEGLMVVGWDDYIIRGIKGELYACKPDIFALTYEPVA